MVLLGLISIVCVLLLLIMPGYDFTIAQNIGIGYHI